MKLSVSLGFETTNNQLLIIIITDTGFFTLQNMPCQFLVYFSVLNVAFGDHHMPTPCLHQGYSKTFCIKFFCCLALAEVCTIWVLSCLVYMPFPVCNSISMEPSESWTLSRFQFVFRIMLLFTGFIVAVLYCLVYVAQKEIRIYFAMSLAQSSGVL